MIGFIRSNQLVLSNAIYYSYWKNESATAIAYLKYRSTIDCARTRAHREDLYLEYGGLKPFDPFVSKNISDVYSISQDGQKYLLERGYPKDKVKISRLGVYPSGSCTLYSDEGLSILSVSYLNPVKRVALIAKAILRLNIKVRWVHIGDGVEFDQVKKITDSNTQNNINIELLGNQPNEFVYDYYRNNHVDLFLNVSSSEGLPVSIMEAYSFGVPCMACDVGGNAEIIDNAWKFLLPAKLHEEMLAKTIIEFYDQRNQWPSFRRNAYTIWGKNYNAIENFKEFAEDLNKPCY
ncbi:glycosyltransferase [Cyclobacterium plantarum]|uniref:glycosyltransferase n=1 Tax=Cyclobacterium plantarum TaxID=2716263 RepID=UPI003F71F4E6